MRILHLVERHGVHTERIALSQQAAGHTVAVATSRDARRRNGVQVYSIPTRVARLPFSHHWQGITEFARIVREFGPDVVHGHYLSTAGLYLLVCAPRPVVASAIGSDVLMDTGAVHSRVLIRALPHWVDRFTSAAPHITRRMVEIGIPEDRITTFPWGVDMDVFGPPPDPPHGFTIVSTRSFEPIYDVATVVTGFAGLAERFAESRLALFADGSMRAALVRQVQQAGLSARVEFRGQVEPRELAQSLRSASVYVSSAVSDGASSSLLEAMATGLVPVVTDIQANRDWIRHGENGLLFPPRNPADLQRALERALTDDRLRETAWRSNPKLVAQRASLEGSMQKLDAVYASVGA